MVDIMDVIQIRLCSGMIVSWMNDAGKVRDAGASRSEKSAVFFHPAAALRNSPLNSPINYSKMFLTVFNAYGFTPGRTSSMNAVNSAMLNLRTVIALFLCLALFACGSSADEVKHKSQEELELGYFYYEGIFLSTAPAGQK